MGMVESYKGTLDVLTALVVASDLRTGTTMLKRSPAENADFYCRVFEVGRRFKILNPEKMRTEYGKLMHILMDAATPELAKALGFSPVVDIQTVHAFLAAKDALDVLRDPRIDDACMAVIAGDRTREELTVLTATKEAALRGIAREHATPELSSDEIERVLLSMGDNHAFLASTRDVCDAAIGLLQKYFSPDNETRGRSLAIFAGDGGARLTHNHVTQYHYVLQSFVLWREIQFEFFKLWHLTEQDLLDPRNEYRLRDTGQGLNRQQSAPRVAQAMSDILSRTMRKVGGGWIGSSAVHLGDHNVPSALVFIDKYTQVPRILNPIVTAIRALGDISARDPAVARYLDEHFGGLEEARFELLRDFFRHGFDGSGAKNFFDAGSCIDGRLTSAWNWCSRIEKQPYFPLMLLTGFVGFDGQF
eukprot:Amastigsp_a176678_22.p1 type:complete len:418 gc:universal Amastigsp_a176678_22:1-1254(+)